MLQTSYYTNARCTSVTLDALKISDNTRPFHLPTLQ